MLLDDKFDIGAYSSERGKQKHGLCTMRDRLSRQNNALEHQILTINNKQFDPHIHHT
jgi:hypothetical protein